MRLDRHSYTSREPTRVSGINNRNVCSHSVDLTLHPFPPHPNHYVILKPTEEYIHIPMRNLTVVQEMHFAIFFLDFPLTVCKLLA